MNTRSSLAHPLRSALAFALLAAGLTTLSPSFAADGDEPAAQEAPEPKMSGLHARVAQDGRIELVASRFSDEELATRRPNYQALKPKVRDNIR